MNETQPTESVQRLSIDAHNKQHARRRIAQEVTLRIGSARLSNLKS